MHAQADIALAELQARMRRALLAPDPAGQLLTEDLFAGAHPGAVGLQVHRNTVLAAASHALRLAYVAVERLVGADFFDRMAVDYARASPPRAPQLDEYDAGFAGWVTGFPGTAQLPYLGELARFDWQLAELGRQRVAAAGGPRLVLEGGVVLQFTAPLRTHVSPYPVDELRTAILGDDIEYLKGADLAPRPRHYAMWRVADGVRVRALGAPSARFIEAALAGADGHAALDAAAVASAAAAATAGAAGEAEPAASQLAEILAREILPAGFVQVSAVAAGASAADASAADES